jgi:hypothetical protein
MKRAPGRRQGEFRDKIVKLHGVSASKWTENRRGGKRRIVERTLPRRSASCKARRLPVASETGAAPLTGLAPSLFAVSGC